MLVNSLYICTFPSFLNAQGNQIIPDTFIATVDKGAAALSRAFDTR